MESVVVVNRIRLELNLIFNQSQIVEHLLDEIQLAGGDFVEIIVLKFPESSRLKWMI